MRRPRRRALPRPRLAHVPRRAVVVAAAVVALLVPGWLWARDSPLARVHQVRISGVSGPEAAAVRQAIETAASRQSTLDVDPQKISEALRPYPVVAGVSVRAHPLHTLDVAVREHLPVGALIHGGRRVAVAADGTVLEGTPTRGLPLVPVAATPGGLRLVERRALGMVALLGAAPRALLGRVASVGLGPKGLSAQLADGPVVYFGAARRLAVKWLAASRVLGDYSSRGASYVDVRVPARPAAGGPPPTGAAPVTAAAPAPAGPDPQLQVQASQ